MSEEYLLSAPLHELMEAAAHKRDQAFGRVITFSPKVFVPLTRLCRDTCSYCTFALPPTQGRRAYMTIDEVLEVARQGAEQGCTEVLLTLGDKPEMRWPEAAAELQAMGYRTTLEYVEAASKAILDHTGMMPHINAGVMGEEDLLRLKEVSASQGLMLEGTAPSLMAPGGAHEGCPDKDPAVRLEVLEAAGRAAVPYTSGILLGIGETRAERINALRAIAASAERHNHIQECIVQNFRAKQNTGMAAVPEPPLEELLWSIAVARLLLPTSVAVQAPPNLTPEADDSQSGGSSSESQMALAWRALLAAGINDLGGISPVTRDFVNPEKPWPHLAPLATAMADAGFLLLPRLGVHPRFVGWAGSAHSSYRLGSASSVGADSFEDASEDVTANGRSSSSSSSSSSNGSASASVHMHATGSGAQSQGAQPQSQQQVRQARRQQHLLQQQHLQQQHKATGLSPSGRPWLSETGGAASVAAAVRRASDSCGYARGNRWCPGLREDSAHQQVEVLEHETRDGTNGSSSSSGSRAAPNAAISKRAAPSWQVVRGMDGTLEGFAQPKQVSPHIRHLLDKVSQFALQTHPVPTTTSDPPEPLPDPKAPWHAQPQDPLKFNPLTEGEIAQLLEARGADFWAVVEAADQLRARVCGNVVTHTVNRNINYTNVCTFGCGFCAFSKGKVSDLVRGPAYLIPMAEITRRTAEAWDRGATEVCMQGGIHPDFTGSTYLDIVAAAKAGAPDMHVHAFSPLEVFEGARSLGVSLADFLTSLHDAGCDSLPGTAAEVLHDGVRAVLCPDKINTAEWLEVVETAHSVGLRTTATLMFGHVEHGPITWAAHLHALRSLQARTSGITEFVPLPFVHMEAPVYLKGLARRGPTLHECMLLHAVSRLALHPHITNIQASWPKMGPEMAAQLMTSGCNDMGGSLMNESITKAAGGPWGQELPPSEMQRFIRAAGRVPLHRTTVYRAPPADRSAASLDPEVAGKPLAPLVFK